MNEDNHANENNNKIVKEDNNKTVSEDNNDSDDDYDSDDNYDEQYYEIEHINNNFKKTDETKSFEDQIDILKKIPWLDDYWHIECYENNKGT